jgi:hypothetical protein
LSVFSSSVNVLWCLQSKVDLYSEDSKRALIEEEKTGNINFTLKTPKDFNRRGKDWQYQLYSKDTKGLSKVDIASFFFFD